MTIHKKNAKFNENEIDPLSIRKPRASQADVAKLVGVSKQTVSRVSNGHPNVDKATRLKVLEAMSALRYRPNSAARALRSGRFRTIGVILLDLSEYGNIKTLDAVAKAITLAGYSITLMTVGQVTQQEVTGAFSRLSEQAVDGIILLLGAEMIDNPNVLLPDGVPVVIVDSDAGNGYTVIDTDQQQGARLATEHLLGLGHRTVTHISGPRDSYAARHRLETWREVLRQHGAPVPEPLIGDWSIETGHRFGQLLAQDPTVTAIFCANDQMALGVLLAMHEANRPVPESVSVMGFDNMAESAAFWPPLTTVAQDFASLGTLTVEALLQTIDGNSAPDRVLIPAELVIRASTGPVSITHK